MKRLWIAVFLTAGILLTASAKADDAQNAPSADPNQERFDRLTQRLDAIEQKENDILKQLDDVKAELQIVKIRASLKN